MNYKKSILFIGLCTSLLSTGTFLSAQAQEAGNPQDTLARTVINLGDDVNKIKRLKITGYIQPQWQYIDSAGAPSVAGGDFINGTSPYFSRFMMRRGRFKFTYEQNIALLMINTDITEKGLFMRETYLKLTDPKWKIFSVAFGLQQVPFGFEVPQSSGDRETPERVRYNQTLFPTERDLGVFGTVSAPKTSALNGLKLTAAILNGSAAVSPEFDSHKDVAGRLTYGKTAKSEKFNFSVGASYYQGGYRIGTVKDYNFGTLKNGDAGFDFANDTANYNRVAKRVYMGADAQCSIDWAAGITTLRAEYITGQQPGTDKSSRSLSAPPASAVYHRNFDGAYFYFIQDIGESKFQVVAKYDWYDPNVDVAGRDIGKPGTNTKLGDIRFETLGFGGTYRIHSNVKIMAYYDMVTNESTRIKGYTRDIRDNVVTIRVQYKY